jgi:hypothetical protein
MSWPSIIHVQNEICSEKQWCLFWNILQMELEGNGLMSCLWILHHNALAHSRNSQHSTGSAHQPYSPHLACNGFYLLSDWKGHKKKCDMGSEQPHTHMKQAHDFTVLIRMVLLDDNHVDRVRLRLWTAATDRPIVHPLGDIWTWRTMVEWYQQVKTPDLSIRVLWQSYQQLSSCKPGGTWQRKWQIWPSKYLYPYFKVIFFTYR